PGEPAEVREEKTKVNPQSDTQRLYEQAVALDLDPEWATARAGYEPQRLYLELMSQCPVAYAPTGTPVLLTMDDILFVNKSRSVEQGSKFLGSNRPAIPLGLD